MTITKENFKEYINSPLGEDVQTLLAYTIDKTPTEVDNRIAEDAGEITTEIAEVLVSVSNQNPSNRDALNAGVNVLKEIAKLTKNKWIISVVSLLSKLV